LILEFKNETVQLSQAEDVSVFSFLVDTKEKRSTVKPFSSWSTRKSLYNTRAGSLSTSQ